MSKTAAIKAFLRSNPGATLDEIVSACACSKSTASRVRTERAADDQAEGAGEAESERAADDQAEGAGEAESERAADDQAEVDTYLGRIAELHELVADLSIENMRLRRALSRKEA